MTLIKPSPILEITETTGSMIIGFGGWYNVLLDTHKGGTWVLQQESPIGNWIDSDLTFDDSGTKIYLLSAAYQYRLTGGMVGAQAWIADCEPRRGSA